MSNAAGFNQESAKLFGDLLAVSIAAVDRLSIERNQAVARLHALPGQIRLEKHREGISEFERSDFEMAARVVERMLFGHEGVTGPDVDEVSA
jgi:hypothetical protein